MVLDTKENYFCMSNHFSSDKEVSPEEVRKADKLLNVHSRAWCKVFCIGEAVGSGQHRRCGRALVNNFSTIPTLLGLRKDHKGDMDVNPIKGPKLGLLAAANKAPNAALGNLVAKLAKLIGDNISGRFGGKIISTQELKRDIDDVN